MNGRVIVFGSRSWTNRSIIADALNDLVLELGYRFPDPVIVHGNARGADRLAADEAGKAGLRTEAHPADWAAHGKAAGLIRNEEMAALGADIGLAFWDNASTGTAHMMACAQNHGIPIRIFVET
jgi:hypothetical protein